MNTAVSNGTPHSRHNHNNAQTSHWRGLASRMALTVTLMIATPLLADDYFLADNGAQWNTASWVRLGDPSAAKVAPSAGNVYWVVQGFTDPASGTSSYHYLNTSGTTVPAPICIGSPSGSPFGLRSGILRTTWGLWTANFSEIRWYNGTLMTENYYHTYSGKISLFQGGDGAVHDFFYDPGYYAVFSGRLASDTPDVAVTVKRKSGTAAQSISYLDGTYNRLVMSGDNFGYKGSFIVDASCAYMPFQIGGIHSLGAPHVPQPAALRLPDNGAVTVLATAGAQSPARGIRLDGNTAYLVVNTGASTLRYSVSRADGVSGTLVKYGLGTNTLDCAYTAGDIVVKQGVLRIGGGAAFPDGQRFTVEDGARLEIGYCPGLGRHTVTCQGTGTYSYPNGVSPTADGGWTWTTSPQNVTGNGYTATFADRVLTIDVESGATASYDYSALAAIGCITNIVKTGAGTWQPAVAPDYHGDFTLVEGTTLLTAPGQFGAEGGTVRKSSGALLQLRGSQVLVCGKRMILAGSVESSDTTSSWGNGLLTDCDLVLQGDLTWTESNTHLAFARRCALDVCGNQLALTAKSWCFSQLYDTVVTNSSATAGKISTSWNRQLRIGDGTELWGGAQNTVEAPSGSNANAAFIFVGKAKGDWTIKPGTSQGSNPSGVRAGQASAANVPGYGYDGPLVISGNTMFNFSQANGCLTFGGKVSGSGTIDVRGGIVNFNGTGHTFSGTVTLTNETSTTLPAAICVGPGAALPGTSARIDAGTLSFAGAQPVTAPLVFAADTTLDMNVEDLTVADMTGFPTVANPARLTITGVWTVTCDDLLGGAALDLGAGELAFGPSASIRVVDRTPALKRCVIARAAGGISGLPSVTGWNAQVSASGGELRLSAPGTVVTFR